MHADVPALSRLDGPFKALQDTSHCVGAHSGNHRVMFFLLSGVAVCLVWRALGQSEKATTAPWPIGMLSLLLKVVHICHCFESEQDIFGTILGAGVSVMSSPSGINHLGAAVKWT